MRCKFSRVCSRYSVCNRNRCCQYKHAALRCTTMLQEKINKNSFGILANMLQIFMKYETLRSCGKCSTYQGDKLTVCHLWCEQFVQPTRFHAVKHFCQNFTSWSLGVCQVACRTAVACNHKDNKYQTYVRLSTFKYVSFPMYFPSVIIATLRRILAPQRMQSQQTPQQRVIFMRR